MAKPFKFRYVNEIVGVFVLTIVGALIVGMFFVGRTQGWFEPKYSLRVRFPEAGAEGVQKGAEVIILGTRVGSVEQILVKDDGSMEGMIIIQGPFARFVRSDSRAIIKRQFGIAGDAFIEITKGDGSPLQGDMLPETAVKDTEILEMTQELVKKLETATLPLLDQFREAAKEYTGLAADLRSPEGHLQKLLARLDELAQGLQEGQGTAGKLLKDPETLDNVNRTIVSVNATVLALKDVLDETRAVMADVKAASSDLPVVMDQTEETIREAEVLMEGVQKHWLLKNYMNKPPPRERIPPSDVMLAEETP